MERRKQRFYLRKQKALVKEKHYLLAIEKLNNIRSKYPYSYYAVDAELLNAEILFLQSNYAEAAAAFLVFKNFHPKSPKSDHVLWMIGESYYKQLPPTYDRDLSGAFKAIESFEELVQYYPNTEYMEKAQIRIKKCKKLLSLKQQYIANFYYKTKVFDSARFRYLEILNDRYKENEVNDQSMLRIVASSLYLNDKEGCLNYYNQYKSIIISSKLKLELNDIYQKCKSL